MPACPHAVVGVEAQDVFEDDTDVAETPRHLVGASDGGHGRVGVQASGMMAGSFAARNGWRVKFRQEALQGLCAQDDATALALCSGRRHCGRGRDP